MRIKTLHIEFTTACNSRCVMCDYWKVNNNRRIDSDLVLSVVAEQVPLGLRKIYFTGGECLVFAEELFLLVKRIRDRFPSVKIGLITNGILLKKYSREISALFEKIIISLDTVDNETYRKVRGIDGVDVIRMGISQIKSQNPQIQVNLRVLVLNETVKGIPRIIEFAFEHNIDRVSFLSEDTGNINAFGRGKGSIINNHISNVSLLELRNIIDSIKVTYESELGSLLRSDLYDLERIYSIYSGENVMFPKCDKPVASCVIGVDGRINPCFFIAGEQRITKERKLSDILSDRVYCEYVNGISAGLNVTCQNCACPKELSE